MTNQIKQLESGHSTFWKCYILGAPQTKQYHCLFLGAPRSWLLHMHFGLIVANQNKKN